MSRQLSALIYRLLHHVAYISFGRSAVAVIAWL
jgi:hypothetical protein